MIAKGTGLVYFFCRSVNFRRTCGFLSSAISTSLPYKKRDAKNSKERNLNEEFLEGNKRKYEDTFGNIESFEMIFQRTKDDPEDTKEYQRERQAQGKTFAQYIKEIKSHLDGFDYKSALKVLEVDMVNDKKPPNIFVYKILISYNARIGNLEEAYRLFVNFKKRQGRVTGAMYTSLFNACANCKSSFFALEKANAVRECMRNNENHVINTSNYNSMMKAYGRHGDLATCLKIMDEVLHKRDKVHSTTYSFLLQACISDKNSGLRHALIVWRKMLQNKVKPTVYSFNLLLRCVRECSLGDGLLVPSLIEEIQKESGKFFKRKIKILTIHNEKKRTVLKVPCDGSDLITPAGSEVLQSKNESIECGTAEVNNVRPEELDGLFTENCRALSQNFSVQQVKHLNNLNTQIELKEIEPDSSETVKFFSNAESTLRKKEFCKNNLKVNILPDESELPNLLALQPSLGSVIKYGVMTEPHYRFMLTGGTKGFLKTMAEFGVKPDIKTFTLMLDVIPSSLEAEQELLSLIEAHKISLDTGFFNVLMKRRFSREEDSSAKDCLQQMHALNLRPDLQTFAVLALGCRTYESGMELLRNVKNCGYRIDNEILCGLLSNAKFTRDMNYVSAILQAAKESGAQLSQKFLADLSGLIRREKLLRKKEEEKKFIKAEDCTVATDSLAS